MQSIMSHPAPLGALPSANPFERLRALLEGVTPAYEPIIMTIGEPRHEIPDFVGEVLQKNLLDFRRYPPINGAESFRVAVADWLDRRYGLAGAIDRKSGVLPLNGSREGLSFAGVAARDYLDKKNDRPAVLLPNPFYQTYAAGAYIAGADAYLLNAGSETGFLPDLDNLSPELLRRTVAFYCASPTNPEGTVASKEYWRKAISLAREHNFMLFADECYSEIYRDTPPPGVLEVAHEMGAGFDRVISLNSLSKRSNLAGLRCGFAAGDPSFLGKWVKFRGLAAPQVPLPLQAVAARVYSDEAHVEKNRRLYNEKFALAERLLSPVFGKVVPQGGFFLWLDVGSQGGGVELARRLFAQTGVMVLPGEFLAADSAGMNPGAPYIRIALVDDLRLVETALTRVAAFLGATV